MSWDQLRDIYEESAERRRDEDSRPPEACPNDGTPLQAGPNGELHCPFDGWVWEG